MHPRTDAHLRLTASFHLQCFSDPNLRRAAIMGWNDHIDTELSDLLDELTAEGYVLEGTPAFDVARKVIAHGKSALTAPEQVVFQDEVVPAIRALAQDRERPEPDAPSPSDISDGRGHE
jgi:hypothetical protein